MFPCWNGRRRHEETEMAKRLFGNDLPGDPISRIDEIGVPLFHNGRLLLDMEWRLRVSHLGLPFCDVVDFAIPEIPADGIPRREILNRDDPCWLTNHPFQIESPTH